MRLGHDFNSCKFAPPTPNPSPPTAKIYKNKKESTGMDPQTTHQYEKIASPLLMIHRISLKALPIPYMNLPHRRLLPKARKEKIPLMLRKSKRLLQMLLLLLLLLLKKLIPKQMSLHLPLEIPLLVTKKILR